ncbi:TetR/AcrR family transcriptional regulator [Georgenia daeguensis]|uniref:HTH tetR-type domain-containing protein n=1 Tax=Georgenia daeguensis TaxID=908355 RepID=A0ABP8EYE0_9MICO
MSAEEHVDPRTRRTRAALARAMAETVLTAPLAEVSVAGLCRTAGVHRTTFYKHFRSVTELADAVLGELFEEIDALGPASDRRVWFEELLEHAAARRRTYAALIGPDGDPALSRAVAERLVAAAGRVLAPAGHDGAAGAATTAARVSGFAAYGAVEAVLLGAEPAAAGRACEPSLTWGEVLPDR